MTSRRWSTIPASPDPPATTSLARTALYLLQDIDRFSRHVIGVPLRSYQSIPLRPIIDSILNRKGHEFLLVFPRQAGKNEAIAHLLVYLLTILQRRGGQIVYGAIGDSLGRGMSRLEERLDTVWTAGYWRKESRPVRYRVGKAAVVFQSSHPRAASRGETAHHLLVIDEAQDQDAAHIEAVFTPMRAAHNATAVYLGTARLTSDFLWTKKRELETISAEDGIRRVFMIGPEEVAAENPTYGQFLAAQVQRYGRQHPIIAAEYYLEPLDGTGGLFPRWRLALLEGDHPRQSTPEDGAIYVAAIDLAGQDEGAGLPGGRLRNPDRDYTVATIFQVADGPDEAAGPIYLAVDVWVDQGSRHFQDLPGQTRLADRLLAYLKHWGVSHTIIDATGVGQGLADWLSSALGDRNVTAFQFGGIAAKARLGSDFLALIETGRFKYWTGDEDLALSDGWWFRRQAAACTYSLPEHGRFDRDLRWGVPDQATIATPAGSLPIHDDRLLSAALIAALERQRRAGRLRLGQSISRVVPAPDPLADDRSAALRRRE